MHLDRCQHTCRTSPIQSGFLTLLLILAVTAMAEERKPHIAVIDFSTKRYAADEVEAITLRLQSELINTNAFVVLDRSQVETILKEQGFQQTGACTSNECQVEMGQMLGVERLVTGNISQVGSLTTFNLNMIDVATGQIVRSFNKDVAGGLEVILTKTCRELASALAAPGGATGQASTPAVIPTAPIAPAAPAIAQPEATAAAVPEPAKAPDAKSPTPEKKASGKSHAWIWWTVGGVALLGGGAAAYLLLAGGEDQVTYQNREPTFGLALQE
jgi:hypothetical protein